MFDVCLFAFAADLPRQLLGRGALANAGEYSCSGNFLGSEIFQIGDRPGADCLADDLATMAVEIRISSRQP
jgi:hypothetical protein